MYGRRGLGGRPVVVGAGYAADGQRSLVLGPGSVVSFLVDVCPSADVYPTIRLLRWWWDRRGRNIAPEAFFFGGMSMKRVKIWLV